MGFRIKVLLHTGAILLVLLLLVWCIVNTRYYATIITLSLFLSFQVFYLLRLLDTTNRQLARFLLAVRHGDFSQTFGNSTADAGFSELTHTFESLMEGFREKHGEQEAQAIWLQAFVEQMPIGLLALDEDGTIALSNRAFRQLAGRQEFKHIDQVALANPALAQALKNLKPGVEESLEIQTSHENRFLSLSCSVLRSGQRQQKLLSIQNIQSAMDAREMQAWQNLIRVMTHEIMNSITPITSLSDTTRQLMQEAHSEATKSGQSQDFITLLEDADNAVQTISNRSQGLTRFVESYRSLSRLPEPRMRHFRVNTLLDSVTRLMQEPGEQARVSLSFTCQPETVEINADPEMLEQALINIVKNAMEAFTSAENPTIRLSAQLKEHRRVELEISDNGSGMNQETLDNLFIPFFTTKRGGSGIGMSVVRQIVRLNKGSIRVKSSPGEGTRVIITLQAGS